MSLSWNNLLTSSLLKMTETLFNLYILDKMLGQGSLVINIHIYAHAHTHLPLIVVTMNLFDCELLLRTIKCLLIL